ncbi:MAG: thiolase family protein [Thermoplasmatota archaeon]
MSEVAIVGAVRTPIGKFGGALKYKKASDLGGHVIKGLLKELELKPTISKKTRSYYPNKLKDKETCKIEQKYMDWKEDYDDIEIDEVIMGNVLQGGQGQNPARQASFKAGIPKDVPSYTVNKVCGSGMKSIVLGAQEIQNDNANVVIAGGMESMTSAPYVLPKARWGYRMNTDGKGDAIDMMVYDGLYEIFYGYHMGVTAENLVELYDISREEQDRLSVESHKRARTAWEKGWFDNEVIPIELKDETMKKDETPRETSLDAVKKLPPVFKKDGTITAGNSSSISDGAAALLLASKTYAVENGLEILGYLREHATAGVDPKYMGLGPTASTKKLLSKCEYSEDEIDLYEENEAFAAEILANMEETGKPKYGVGMNEKGSDTINPKGSGISLGHPIGCTGARITVTLLHELKRINKDIGLASLCIGGGMGISVLIER